MSSRNLASACTLVFCCAQASMAAAEDSAELAKKLSNPVAALISVPLQYNYDHHYGPDKNGHKSYLNVQPVVPISLNADWNVISRTIVPIASQSGVIPGSSESGLGDVTQSLFFSPKAPTSSGIIWGVGPAFLLPTGTDPNLSARKWGAGPTGVILKQDGPWTYGALASHIWGVGGSSSRRDLSNTFLQPFLSYTTKDAWTYSLNTESTYDWKAKEWSLPINLMVSKLVKFGTQPVSLGGGVRYWADNPDTGAHDVGVRFVMTFLFPK
ncbi:transporter [Herminiimonas contaminans]|uniref:Transporter n=2 Tax=Herminiimonas contaminans TaxID=1111140 RepID=A0ABS0EY51_9BURK|nr:transporter [Herminiimonas contaminans]